MEFKQLSVNKILVKERVREDFGNMESLINSIKKYGLINPILVSSNNRLIAGERRLRAFKELGYKMIDVRVIASGGRIEEFNLELQENFIRKDFTENEVDKSIEMKKKLLKKHWFKRFIAFIKKIFNKIFK